MSKDQAKEKKLKSLWEEAYKSSHVCADLTEKAHPVNADDQEAIDWLLEETRKLNCTAIAIKNLTSGATTETLAT